MKRWGLTISFVLALGFVASGCGRSSCNAIYDECKSNISVDKDEFVEDCVEEYWDEDGDCRDAVRDFAKCVKDEGCDDIECLGDYWDVGDECGVDALGIAVQK